MDYFVRWSWDFTSRTWQVLLGASLLLTLGMAVARRQPSAEEATALMERRVRTAIRERRLAADLERYLTYLNGRLDASAGTNTFSDKTGNCRLPWVDRILRNPLEAPAEAERFSRKIYGTLARPAGALEATLPLLMRPMGVSMTPPDRRKRKPIAGWEFTLWTSAVHRIATAWADAWAGIPEPERNAFLGRLVEQALGTNELGHRFASVTEGRAVCDRLEQLDLNALGGAAADTVFLADRILEGDFDAWFDELRTLSPTGQVEGVEGPVLACWEMPFGLMVVGGPGPNRYRLDDNRALAVILDLDGDDRYEEGTLGGDRPILIIVDVRGNDLYRGIKTGVQGGAVGGVSLLVDRAGDDRYEAADLAQGSALAGIGILVDQTGNDIYRADRRAQGQAVGGIGVLLDCSGDDHYHGAMLVQGVGGPLGLGLLADRRGNDRYWAGGKYPGGYDDSPGFGGWSQGVGVGPRGVANGGIGLLLDGEGDDEYEYDYFSHGGGYWFAVGIARDFAGHDRRKGSGTIVWDGSPRTVRPFVRWGPAYGCHYAAGFVFDDGGDDLYIGTTAGPCFAWDLAVAVLCDASGDDEYQGHNLGCAAQGGMAMLWDGAGRDHYRDFGSRRIGWADPIIAYHPDLATNANFTFVFDEGGAEDVWESGISNRSSHVRGWAGGVLVDR